jgi:hypothetical protein
MVPYLLDITKSTIAVVPHSVVTWNQHSPLRLTPSYKEMNIYCVPYTEAHCTITLYNPIVQLLHALAQVLGQNGWVGILNSYSLRN